MLYGFMNFGRRAVERLQRGLVAALLAVLFLSLVSGQAYALSWACGEINKTWSAGQTFGFGQGLNMGGYRDFSPGEEVVYTAYTTNSSAGDLDGGFNAPSLTISDVAVGTLVEASPGDGAEVDVSDTLKPDAASNYSIYAKGTNFFGSQSQLYVHVECLAGPPTITFISPNQGSPEGGESVWIAGADMKDATVLFGGVSATVLESNDNGVTVEAPPSEAGVVDVTVTTARGTTTRTGGYTYFISLDLNPADGFNFGEIDKDARFSRTFTASGGTAPYTYELYGSIPGLMLDAETGELSGTPSQTGPHYFAVSVNDDHGGIGMASYSLTVVESDEPAFTVNPASGKLPIAVVDQTYKTVVFWASLNPTHIYSRIVSGHIPTGMLLDNRFGTVPNIYGTPTELGEFTFTMEFEDEAHNIVTETYTIDVRESLPSADADLSDLTLSAGTLQPAFNSATTSYSVTVANEVSSIGITPTASHELAQIVIDGEVVLSGAAKAVSLDIGPNPVKLEVRAEDETLKTYNLSIFRAPPVLSLILTPGSGALPKAMAGEAYSAAISATGGNGKLIYSLVPADGLPKGLVLNVSTGAISGALAEDAEIKDYGFAVSVEDADGASAKADYTLTVVERQAGVEDKVVSVPVGSTPLDVRLDANATGGPFTDAAVAFVDPPNAGEAEVTMGDYAAIGSATPVGWYLKFKPNPAFSGKAVVGFTLTNANLGGAVQTASGTVTYMLAIDAAQVATDIDRLVHGFVGTRQSMISSTIAVPGLRERRASAAASGPVTGDLSPNANGLTLNFATSLVQMNAAARATAGIVEVDAVPEAFNIWLDGTVMVHNREQNGDRWGSFAMLSLGADYLVNERALIGLSLHLDRMTDPTDQDAELVGTGWLAGPYASLELGEGVFFDASLRYGGSWNDIDTPLFDGSFDTTRWMLDASLSGQWRLGEGTVVTPKLRTVYFNEAVESYTVENAIGDIITIDGFTKEQFRLSVGAELAHSFVLENGLTLTPSIGATAGLSTLDATSLFGQATAGLSLSDNDGWNLDGGVLINFNNEGAVSAGAKASLKLRF